MEQRLIDANALRKNMEFICMGIMAGTEPYNAPLTEIDNAPTVEPEKVLVANVTFDEDKLKEIVQTEVIDKIKNGELVIQEERPQGEWELVTEGIDSNTYKCQLCGRLINCDRPRLKLYPFCHCGADMRGKEK